MNRLGHIRWLLAFALGLFVTLSGRAQSSPVQNPANIVDVKLTGLSLLSGNKKAYLLIHDQPRTLAEGQSDGNIEVLQIDEQTSHVKIRNAGKEEELSFSANGIQLPPAPVSAPAPPAAVVQVTQSQPDRLAENSQSSAGSSKPVVIGHNSSRANVPLQARAGAGSSGDSFGGNQGGMAFHRPAKVKAGAQNPASASQPVNSMPYQQAAPSQNSFGSSSAAIIRYGGQQQSGAVSFSAGGGGADRAGMMDSLNNR